MSRINIRALCNQLPFSNLSNFDIELNFQTIKAKIIRLMDNHGLDYFINESHFTGLFNPDQINTCNYYDENDFNQLKRNELKHLNIFSMNIRSLPKHGGELVCFLKFVRS